MKYLLLLFITTLCIASCSKQKEKPSIESTWNLMHLSGGLAGVNCDFNAGDHTWTIDEDEVEIQSGANPEVLCINFLGSDNVFSYSILDTLGRSFLIMENYVSGELFLEGEMMTLDMNSGPTGTGADGFYYEFEKQQD